MRPPRASSGTHPPRADCDGRAMDYQHLLTKLTISTVAR